MNYFKASFLALSLLIAPTYLSAVTAANSVSNRSITAWIEYSNLNVSLQDQGNWSQSVSVGINANLVKASINSQGNAAVAYTTNFNQNQNKLYVVTYDGTWSTPLLISDSHAEDVGNFTISVADDNSILVNWESSSYYSSTIDNKGKYADPTGTWGSTVKIN